MASSTTAPYSQPVRSMISRVKVLLNKYLVGILKEEGLPYNGLKHQMQARLINHIEALVRESRQDRLDRLQNLVYNPESVVGVQTAAGQATQGSKANTKRAAYNGATHTFGRQPALPSHASTALMARPRFKESPFFTVMGPLSPAQTCPVMPHHRHTSTFRFRLQKEVVEKLQADPAMRLMLYCGVDDSLGIYVAGIDMAFPHQVELKINGQDIKANFRGLKKKPGSARPVDITSKCQLVENYENSLVMTYALTEKKYFYVVNLVKAQSVEYLVHQLKTRRSINKESVIQEMISRAQDSDLVATSTVMSLRCPLSALRLQLPCRSTVCTHNQCFDATSFLQLQEQGETWSCPICSKTISFEALAVDQYVKDILESTPSSLEQVKIEPDGRWADASGTEPSAAGNINAGDSRDGNDDDELLEIRSTRINDLRSTPNTKTPPATVDRSSTTYTEPPRSGASKRSHDQIIDLTLSDEEDSVAPGGKRPALNWTPSVPKPGSFSGGTASASSNPSSGVRLSLHPPTQRFHSLPSGSPIPPAPGRET